MGIFDGFFKSKKNQDEVEVRLASVAAAEVPPGNKTEKTETPPAPEKSRDELYMDAIKAKKNVLEAFHQMNEWRKGRDPKGLNAQEKSDYLLLKENWLNKQKELRGATDNLSETDRDFLASIGNSRANIVELTLIQLRAVKTEQTETEKISAEPEAAPESIAPVENPEIAAAEKQTQRDKILGEIKELEARVEHAQRTFRIPGIGPEGESLAKEELAEAKARLENLDKEMEERKRMNGKEAEAAQLRGKLNEIDNQLDEKRRARLVLDEEMKVVEERTFHAKATGREPGIGPEGLTLAEADKKEIEAKQKALDKEINSLEKQRQKVSKQLEDLDSKAKAKPGFIQKIRDRFKKRKERIDKAEAESEVPAVMSAGAEPAADVALDKTNSESSPVTSKKPTKWSWWKERLKGLSTVGGLEIYHAEKMRRGTNTAENDVVAYAENIAHDKNMDLEEAHEYTNRIKKESERTGVDFMAIVARKDKENADFIERGVNRGVEVLMEKLRKYKGESGQEVLTPENIEAVKRELREAMNKIRSGAAVKDMQRFAEIMRGNLDAFWKMRYVYGAGEAIVDAFLVLGGYHLVGWLTGKGAVAEKLAAASAKGGGALTHEGVSQVVQETINQNIWHTLETTAQSHGIHLSNGQLMEASKEVMSLNHFSEPQWVDTIVKGWQSTRQLPMDTVLKIPAEVAKLIGSIH